MSLELLKLNLIRDTSVGELLQLLPEIEEDVNIIAYTRFKELAQIGQEAFRSYVPIKTGQLRDREIKIRIYNSAAPRVSTATASIFVPDVEHTSSRKGRRLFNLTPATISAPDLAERLNDGTHELGMQMHRRKSAQPTGPRFTSVPGRSEPTKNWIEDAISAFEVYLSSDGQ